MAALYALPLLGLLLFHTAPAPCSSATPPPPPSSSPASDTLMAGQALAMDDKLVSRNGKFALGFYQPASAAAASAVADKSGTTTAATNWYVGIWFNKIPVLTIVWVANRDDPITNPMINQTHLKISSDGNLVIMNHESVIWSTQIVTTNRTQTSVDNTSVVLNDTANLVLKESPTSDLLLWQSFDYPTDLVLPGAKFGWNKITGLNRGATSKKSLIDPGLGSYSIELETNGTGINLKSRNPSVVYRNYASESSSVLKLMPRIVKMLELDPRSKALVHPIYMNNKEEEYYMYTSPDESASTFLFLDTSGQIKLNFWSEAKQSWQTILADPLDVCTPPAACGPFTVCKGNAQPSCGCMESFSVKSPWNWQFDDRTDGCIRNTPLYCTNSTNTTSSPDTFLPIARVTLPYDSRNIDAATTPSMCEEACLSSCSCTAYSYNNSVCSVWNGELRGVNVNDGIEITSEDILYLRLAAKDKNKRKSNVGVVAAVVSISSVGLLMVVLFLVIRRNKLLCFDSLINKNQGTTGIIAFKYTDLAHATKNFSEKLGGGGFGSVYKGVLSDSTAIAVKRLDGIGQVEKQFRAEVSSIGLIQHVNLVKLIGFCCQGDNRLLVYEHMLNGSLDVHLFKSNAVLNWDTRYQIVLGIARGLSYLHHSCRECIIHCDIKPENILLDASFVPKVADFGMASIVGRNFSRVLTTFRGTIGYLAPEWLSGVAITPKVDVYSFGMVLLEVMSGRRDSSQAHTNSGDHVEYFHVQAIIKLHGGDMHSLVDPQLHGDFNLKQVEWVCKVALWCIQDNEFDRPTMSEVVQVLEGLQEIDMPPMPRLLATITQQQT